MRPEQYIGAFLVLVVICGFVFLMGFDVVDASHIGVKNRLGVVTGTMQPGMQWTGWLTDVEQYNLRTQKDSIEMLAGEQTAVDIDGQNVKARIEINYRFNPENIVDMFTKVGKANDVITVLNIEGIIREGFKSTTSQYKSKEIWQKRNEVKEEAIKRISANFPNDYVILENVIIADLDFNPEFLAAIEKQKANEELAIAKEKEVEIASNEALRVAAVAGGEAEAKKLRADADAYERLKIAESEAKSLEMKSKELTPLMVQNNWIDAWASGGAQVPQWMMGEGGSNFLMNIPAPGQTESEPQFKLRLAE